MTQASSTQTPASDSPLFDPADIDRLRQPRKPEPSNSVYAFIAAIVALVGYIGYDQYNKYSANQAAIAKKAVAEQRAAEEQRTNEIADLKAKLEAAEAKLKTTATPSSATAPAPSENPKVTALTGWGVVTDTLYNYSQTGALLTENAKAFDACAPAGHPLKPCFVRVWDKALNTHPLQLVVLSDNIKDKAGAEGLKDCLASALPKLENGAKEPYAVDMSSNVYKGKNCVQ